MLVSDLVVKATLGLSSTEEKEDLMVTSLVLLNYYFLLETGLRVLNLLSRTISIMALLHE